MFIKDLGSSNGTFINEVNGKIETTEIEAIEGDFVGFGKYINSRPMFSLSSSCFFLYFLQAAAKKC